jgi:hypothetical protein
VKQQSSAVRYGFCNKIVHMRLPDLAVLVLVGSATAAGAQTTAPAAKPSSRTLTLSGCVQRTDTADAQYTLIDRKDGKTYRLSGTDVRDYVGKRVRVVGGVVASKRLQISGGLKPTPNVAAQAGAMDPSQAATAAAGGAAPGSGPVPTLEFRIKNIRPAEGGCPE